ncbi:ribonuclease M5 [Bacillus sp. CGMCC 1.16541]|uniref:ribonuclease M5 n=1 Tax=Bacillus sp. CGMCC 1.16541 TaxID=2185143 RepID=UPI000D72AE0A|nr:ribonuclease M5 [Bacillus sp. CGMCC 1.16541]
MKIKEIIVVEGKDDTVAIQRAVNADTIETNGSAVSDETIEKIRLAQKKRGVIIFTDPDYPGQRIRNIITERVSGCKHAFLSKDEARPKSGKGIGVEHASLESIREALKAAQQEWINVEEEISKQDLLDVGLIGGTQAKERREKLGIVLKIGYANGKQLHKRLTMFQIPRAVFIEAIERINKEDVNNW